MKKKFFVIIINAVLAMVLVTGCNDTIEDTLGERTVGSAILPNPAIVGEVISITGADFRTATAVVFSGAGPVTVFEKLGDFQINVVVPTGATAGPITVNMPGGNYTIPTNLRLTALAITNVGSSVRANNAQAVNPQGIILAEFESETLTFTGTGLTRVVSVEFPDDIRGVPLVVNSFSLTRSETVMTAAIPSGRELPPGVHDVTVTFSNGFTSVHEVDFTGAWKPDLHFRALAGKWGAGRNWVWFETNISNARPIPSTPAGIFRAEDQAWAPQTGAGEGRRIGLTEQFPNADIDFWHQGAAVRLRFQSTRSGTPAVQRDIYSFTRQDGVVREGFYEVDMTRVYNNDAPSGDLADVFALGKITLVQYTYAQYFNIPATQQITPRQAVEYYRYLHDFTILGGKVDQLKGTEWDELADDYFTDMDNDEIADWFESVGDIDAFFDAIKAPEYSGNLRTWYILRISAREDGDFITYNFFNNHIYQLVLASEIYDGNKRMYFAYR